MKVLAKQNRELIMINPQNTQNENDAEKIILQVPEQYEDFNKKIVFITPDGNVWDIITNNEYLIKKAITKYQQVEFYIWLTKGDVDFRSRTKTLKFYDNVDASDEITDEEIGRVNTVVNLLEEEITKVENLETEIDGKLEEVDTAIDNINTAIQETENLNLDAEKVGQTTTVTLTKKDGTTKVVHVDDGVDLQFMWQGTSLGIKTAEQQEYTFVNLQGVQGQRGEQGEPFTIKKTYSSVAEMNADFNNMQLGDYVMIASTVEVEDNAKLYTRGENQWIFITDFSGATGIRGETGLTPNIQIGTVTQGTSFNVTRTGTNENPVLNFTLVKGDKGDRGIQGIQGLTGNGISSITKTSTSGLVDTYTITYTNGNTTTFTITNGEDGEVTETELNVLRQKLENQQKVIDQLPQVEGQGTSITLENTIEAPFTKFDVEGNSTQESTKGDNIISSENIDVTYMGVKYLSQNNGTILANGTKYGGAYFNLTDNIVTLENDTYSSKVFLLNGSISRDGTNLHPTVYLMNQADTSKSYNIGEIGNPGKSQLIEAGTYHIRIATWQDNVIFANAEIGIMLVKGSTIPTDFEKFTYGASPNPNYEQPIKSAGDNIQLFDKSTAILNKYINNQGEEVASAGFYASDYISVIPNTNIILSGNTIFTPYVASKGAFYDENKSFISYVNIAIGDNIYTVPNNAKYYRTTVKPVDIDNIKVSKGTTASGYSPYGMGSINEKISNKNLCKITDFSKAVANVQIKAENNILSFNGTTNNTISANDAIWKNIKLEVKEKGVYTPSLEKSITGVAFGYYKENSSTLISPYSELEVGSYTLGIYVPANTAFNNFTTGVQIEKGSTATPYVEHQEQDYSIFVQQPMRSIGDVRDCFVKKSDGWYERHLQYIASYNGETLPQDVYNEVDNVKYCNEKSMSTTGQFSIGASVQYIDENNWNDLPCTPEQIQQLENKPSTYKDFTIINSEDETEAYLEVSGIYDLNKLINN